MCRSDGRSASNPAPPPERHLFTGLTWAPRGCGRWRRRGARGQPSIANSCNASSRTYKMDVVTSRRGGAGAADLSLKLGVAPNDGGPGGGVSRLAEPAARPWADLLGPSSRVTLLVALGGIKGSGGRRGMISTAEAAARLARAEAAGRLCGTAAANIRRWLTEAPFAKYRQRLLEDIEQ